VPLHGAIADVEPPTDGAVGQAAGGHLQHIELAPRERLG